MIKKYKFNLFIYLFILFIISYVILGSLNSNYIIETSDELSKQLVNGLVGDSRYYYHLYLRTDFNIDNLLTILFVNKNLIPPLLQLYIVDKNLDILYIFYFISLSFAIFSSVKYIEYNKNIFIVFIIFFPVMFGSLYGVNKEIVSYISVLFILSYILAKRIKFLLFALFFALLTRAELVLVILLFLIFLNFKKVKRLYILIFVLIGISLVIKITGYSDINRLTIGARENSLGLVMFIDYLNTLGLYFITFFLKSLINLYALVLSPAVTSMPGWFLTISSYSFFIFSLIIIKKKILNINNDVVFFIILYLFFFCVPSFIQHRYFIALYPLFVYLSFCYRPKISIKR